jgi:hypothetical protein
MGKAAKIIVPVAAVGLTLWSAGAFAPAVSAYAGSGINFAAGTAATSGFSFGNLFSGFSMSKGTAALGLQAISAASSIAGGMAGQQQAQLGIQQEAIRQRKARLQALQLEAQALRQGSQSINTAKAKAAGQNLDTSGRSFMAFVDDQEKEVENTIDVIRVNAENTVKTSQLRMRQLNSQGTGAMISGIGGATRSLLTATARA